MTETSHKTAQEAQIELQRQQALGRRGYILHYNATWYGVRTWR